MSEASRFGAWADVCIKEKGRLGGVGLGSELVFTRPGPGGYRSMLTIDLICQQLIVDFDQSTANHCL